MRGGGGGEGDGHWLTGAHPPHHLPDVKLRQVGAALSHRDDRCVGQLFAAAVCCGRVEVRWWCPLGWLVS